MTNFKLIFCPNCQFSLIWFLDFGAFRFHLLSPPYHPHHLIMTDYNRIVEKLIATVARAFYTDMFIVVFDTLVREKFIREEELPPRLKVINKDIRQIILQLEQEMLIKFENLIMEDGRHAKCYYIDYQTFVHVVRYRIMIMKKALSSDERRANTEDIWHCPTCKNTFSSLEVLNQRNNQFKFVCLDCCPYEDFKNAPSEPSFILVRADRNAGAAKNLVDKFNEQMSESPDHDGIFALLDQLKDVPLIRNLPSENRRRGISASRVVDSEMQREISENIGHKRVSAEAKTRASSGQIIMGREMNASQFSVTVKAPITSSSSSSSSSSQFLNTTDSSSLSQLDVDQEAKRRAIEKDTSLPSFLVNSRVVTAEQLQQRHQQQLVTGVPAINTITTQPVMSSNNAGSMSLNSQTMLLIPSIPVPAVAPPPVTVTAASFVAAAFAFADSSGTVIPPPPSVSATTAGTASKEGEIAPETTAVTATAGEATEAEEAVDDDDIQWEDD